MEVVIGKLIHHLYIFLFIWINFPWTDLFIFSHNVFLIKNIVWPVVVNILKHFCRPRLYIGKIFVYNARFPGFESQRVDWKINLKKKKMSQTMCSLNQINSGNFFFTIHISLVEHWTNICVLSSVKESLIPLIQELTHSKAQGIINGIRFDLYRHSK